MPKFADIPSNIGEIISSHIKLYLEHPEQAHMWDSTVVGVPGPVTTLLLTTTGRKTGKQRHVPLLYVDDGDGYLIIGSKGGDADHPVWYKNLQADPNCDIRVSTLHTKARARSLTGDEYDRAWARITAKHNVYSKYQSRTERTIPVVRLEPVKG